MANWRKIPVKMTVRFRLLDRLKILLGFRITTVVELTINSSLITVKKTEAAIIHWPKSKRQEAIDNIKKLNKETKERGLVIQSKN